jgi:hypothetical protein
MNFNEILDFSKEFKKLLKKFKSLNKDLENFKKVIPYISFTDNKNFSIINRTKEVEIVKGRLFCEYLKKSSLRIIFSWNQSAQQIEFIEIYHKGNQENENRARIKKYREEIINK